MAPRRRNPRKGDVVKRRSDGGRATVTGFTTKPDGRKRVKLEQETGKTTSFLIDHFDKSYTLQ